MPIYLHIVYDCFHPTKAALSSFNRDHVTNLKLGWQAKNIYYLPFIEKVANP